jgi:hypothetical protein
MNTIVFDAINSVNRSKNAFCKFISANDAGDTGAHQSGFYIPKNSVELIFDTPGVKGENKDRFVKIKWQNEFETESRFIYYGTRTRNEYRLTRFGKGFPFLSDNHVGDLLIISQISKDYYEGYVLSFDEDIEDFFATFNISSNQTNQLINKTVSITAKESILKCFLLYVENLKSDFPPTIEIANKARECFNQAHNIKANDIRNNPDKGLIDWLDAEYQLFKTIENLRYKDKLATPFKEVENLVEFANMILNRRKSRAGKSLEHHLAEIFNTFSLEYKSQAITEDNKKPDFIFPNSSAYQNPKFNTDKLVFLASKTTCKDRWRQIINEADRIKIKHLFTLQQGISSNQLKEMYKYNVCLVVPKPYLKSFPLEFHSKIFTLDNFINYVAEKQK